MIIRDAALDVVCGVKSALPAGEMPQIAFAGKSNVGKSSLINRLLGRKSLARTSSQPGKTQTINFYRVRMRTEETAADASAEVSDKELYLVDLPGYGYTKVTESVKADWGRMVERFLHHSEMLKAAEG